MENQDHPLSLYDSLSREVRRFVPQDPKNVTMYNCGPTVYSYAHIGNARAAVVADVLFRVLRHIYGEDHVRYARNLTDVDDRIIASAMELGVPISEITEKYARIYNEDLDALNCLPPTVQPKATEHIQQMADIIVTLMDKDAAYLAEGHIYFDVTKDEDYGKLSGRKLEDNLAGARVEVVGAKRNAADFVLWKPSPDGEPGWSQQQTSTSYFVDWGKYGNRDFATKPGRPGWHIECSAMAKETLGETIDIHCGGIDLRFPHHENEIAQSETANDKTFANYWVHNEFLNMGKDKMSKSLGNVVLVHDLLKDWDGEVIRLALLKAHYRNELIWSEDLLRESKRNLDRWYNTLSRFKDIYDQVELGVRNKFEALTASIRKKNRHGLLKEDLDTVQQIFQIQNNDKNLIYYLAGDALAEYHGNLLVEEYEVFMERANLLGLLQRDPEDWFRGNASDDETAEFDALAAARHAARQANDWAEADRIRDEGTARGIVFEDSAEGTSWRKA
ncbi:cysteine--tRNA ligase [Algimonas ampicilliniresistens]|uniref:Cysteine--tRNA ligase n=1 Tax=Algimonas ampicilliniresistens TaxID=1298735 RepID=A0ABQ5VC28_9PROT|nr:cysteine--tRNA ligase [Algimonas ampicilliniresistens]GLQ25054.1 cysteine--tRNA ligase [Algimonas ampicilliniresistens]